MLWIKKSIANSGTCEKLLGIVSYSDGYHAIWNVMTIYQIRTSHSEKNFNTNQKGSARWTTNREIKEQYRGIPDRDETFPGAGGTIISRIGKTLYIDDALTNNLIIGITRSGKGEMFVIPSIDVYSRAEEKTSMVITDPKMELYKTSKKTLEERGYLVYLLNLDDPLHSMGFNPLEQIKEEYLKKNYAEAELLAQAFSFSIFNPDSATEPRFLLARNRSFAIDCINLGSYSRLCKRRRAYE